MPRLALPLALLAVAAIVDRMNALPSALTHDCGMYLSTSSLCDAGRGVFTGVFRPKGSPIEESLNIPIKHEHTRDTQLSYYVFDTGFENFVMAVLGVGSLINHHDAPNVDHIWSEFNIPSPSSISTEPQSVFTGATFRALQSLKAGQELFNSYGEDWFSGREVCGGACEQTPSEQSQTAICLTDVYSDRSQIDGAGKGLFASRQFTAGEVITVSPVVLLRVEALQMTVNSSVLLNYCLHSPGSAVALLPMSHAAFVNHGGARANVKWSWFTWKDADWASETSTPLEELLQAPYAPLDIALRATRDIDEGEEILVDYGQDWEEAWREASPGSFRKMIHVPPGLFPRSWHEVASPLKVHDNESTHSGREGEPRRERG